MTTNYAGLIEELKASGHRYGLLTMQATSTTRRLVNALPGKMTALFSAEHGFFGNVAAGEKTASTWHPFWNVPIHSLYGDHRKPNDEMMVGVEHMVIDLMDLGDPQTVGQFLLGHAVAVVGFHVHLVQYRLSQLMGGYGSVGIRVHVDQFDLTS